MSAVGSCSAFSDNFCINNSPLPISTESSYKEAERKDFALSEAIRHQYSILNELKRLDDKVARLQRDLNSIPEQIKQLEANLAKRREEFDKVKTVTDTHEKTVRKAEADLREKEDHLKKAESKMMEVKTNEEYAAAMRENDGTKKEKGVLEEKLLKLISELEEHKGKLKQAESVYKEFEVKAKAEQKTLEEERKRVSSDYEQLVGKRSTIAKDLEPSVSVLYNRILGRTRGAGAIALVDNGLCLSCNMRVRPQLYNEVLGCKAVHQCSSCGLLLILPPTQAAEPSDAVHP